VRPSPPLTPTSAPEAGWPPAAGPGASPACRPACATGWPRATRPTPRARSTCGRAAPAAPITAYREAIAAAADAIVPELTARAPGRGLERLRAALAERTRAVGCPTAPEEILVTSGAMPGLWLVAAALFRRAPAALVETPTYPGALDALRQRRSRLVGWPMADGWEPAEFERLVREHEVSVAYLVPDFHNPTGRLMDAGTREALRAAAARRDVLLVVDETMADLDLRTDGPAPPPLGGPGVVTLGSLSKSVWDGLRVGWIRADAATIERLAVHPLAAQVATAPLEEAIAAELLTRLDALVADRRSGLRENRDHLLGALSTLDGIGVTHAPDGGLCVWATLERASSARLAVAAAERGVLLDPGGRYAPAGGLDRGLRVPFSLPAPQLDTALERLAPLL
jgi:DNA-binding transcriptional MocR family regulator